MVTIEFNGYLTGNAEKHFRIKSTRLGQNLLFLGAIAVLPFIIYIALQMKQNVVIYAYIVLVASIPLFMRIPQSKKKQLAITPKRIIIRDGELVCIADQYQETKYIDDVKLVFDYGEFYDIVFPFGKISEKFVCQKSLLTQGTVDDFEEIFKGKICKK